MSGYILKILPFAVLNILVFFLVARFPEMRFDFTHETNKSVVLTMPSKQDYDLLIMGTSHGRNLSNSGNHSRVEKILNKRIWNIAKDGGHGGIFPELMFLEHFYGKGNDASTILYFVDPWVFYAREWNEDNYFLEGESVDLLFLWYVIREGTSRKTIVNHLQYKLDPVWFLAKPDSLLPDVRKVPSREFALGVCEREVGRLYMEGLNHENFERYATMFERTINLMEARGAHVVLAWPVSLCPLPPGREKVEVFLKDLAKRHHLEIYDFSNAMTDPELFYDYNHLNTKGMELFAEKYLLPIVGSTTTPVTFPPQRGSH